MPEFVIEREIPGASKMTPAQLEAASLRSVEVLKDLGPNIRWVRSFVTDDKIYCVYFATEIELIYEHARRLGLPVDRIEAVRSMLDPSDLEKSN